MSQQKQVIKFDSVDSEREILNVIVNNPHVAGLFVHELEPEFFRDTTSKFVIKAIRVYFQKHSGMPTEATVKTLMRRLVSKPEKGKKQITLPNDFENKVATIFEQKSYKSHQVSFYEAEIEKFIKMNKVRDAFYESVDIIDDVTSFDKILEKFTKAVMWQTDKDLGVEISRVKERYDRINSVFENFVPLPYPQLSVAIGGGMLPKSLHFIAAASGVGKSIVLDQAAFHCWKNLGMNVIIASFELSEEVKSLRIDCQFLRMTSSELRKNVNVVEDAYHAIGDKGNMLFVKEFPARGACSLDIARYIHRLRLFYGIDIGLIVVDYSDIVLPNSGRTDSLYQAGGDVSEELRALGYTYNCPVLTATQLNRDGNKNLSINEVDRSMIAESQKKTNTADSLIAFAATTQEKANGEMYAKTLKARFGRENVIVPFNVQYEFLCMDEA